MSVCIFAAEDLSSAFGFFFWGFLISTVLLGVIAVQGYLYFENNSDRLVLRALVSAVLILDLAGSILIAQTMHYYLVQNFGNPSVISQLTKTFIGEYVTTAITILLSQLFYASRIYAAGTAFMNNYGRYAGMGVAILAVVALGSAIGGCYELLVKDRLLSNLAVPETKVLFSLAKLPAALCDGLATLSMCYFLSSQQSSFKSTKSLLRWFWFFSVNRGALVCAAQIGNMITYLIWPASMHWVTFHLAISKLHTITLLAMLNSRPSLRSRFLVDAKFFDGLDIAHSPVKVENLATSQDIRKGSKSTSKEIALTPDSPRRGQPKTPHTFGTRNEASSSSDIEMIDIRDNRWHSSESEEGPRLL